MFVNTKLSNQRWNHTPKRDLSFFIFFFMYFSCLTFISVIVQWPYGSHGPSTAKSGTTNQVSSSCPPPRPHVPPLQGGRGRVPRLHGGGLHLGPVCRPGAGWPQYRRDLRVSAHLPGRGAGPWGPGLGNWPLSRKLGRVALLWALCSGYNRTINHSMLKDRRVHG